MDTPLGDLRVIASAQGITNIVFCDSKKTPAAVELGETPLLKQAAGELTEYFAGAREIFTFPLDLKGTAFQLEVWRALKNIRYGTTTSYGELARALGKPKAARPVGGANSANPVWIVLPCHRVVGSSGKLVGYGGGIVKKQWLLKHEQEHKG